jgi:hypothetical protein
VTGAGRRAVVVGREKAFTDAGGGLAVDRCRVERAGELFGLTPRQVDAALNYYADYQSDIDDRFAANVAAANEAEAAWRRRQGLLAR